MAGAAADWDTGLRLSREAYRHWAEAQSRGRFERIDGEVIAMAPERAGHADRKALAWLVLRQAVAAAALPCHVYPDGMTVVVDESDFEPDVVLRCGPRLAADAVAVPDPIVIVEVLSPSTRAIDMHRKLTACFRLPSVRHYLILQPDRPQVIHHRRRDDADGIDTRVQATGEISLAPPGIVITVEDLYRD